MALPGRWPRFVEANPVRWGSAFAGVCLIALLVLLGLLPPWVLPLVLGLVIAAGLVLFLRRSADRATAPPAHRLAAVWFADVVDYSRLASEDEGAAIRLVRAFHSAARTPVEAHGGRIVKTLGDGVLAAFPSTEAAIRAALELRQRFVSSTADGPADGHDIRIGIHVGDVALLPDGDVYGEGVNVAYRLQGTAAPGQVLVSEDVFRQLRQRPELEFEPLGERELKGSREPMDVFRVEVASDVAPRAVQRSIGISPSRRTLAGIAAGSVALSAFGLWALMRDGGQRLLPDAAYADAAAPGVAVLPFRVTGADPEEWREPMIDLLSKNLDGVTGLRAIETRTVLARWRESDAGEGGVAPATGLAIARRTGARYTVIGDAVAIGGGVRLRAELYDVTTGRRLGQAQVEGRSEDLLLLIDQLTIRLLGFLLQEDTTPGVSLASVTTDSLEALKAYLEGERRFRRSSYDAAIEAYERAIAIDPTFAAALYRLALATSYSDLALSLEYAERAARLQHRLTPRDRAVLMGHVALERGTLHGLEILQQAVERYPDDLEAWYQLGETLYHLGPQVLAGPEAAERAFTRTLEIDSTFSVVHAHLIEIAFGVHDDAARAARLIDALAAVSDNRRDVDLYRLGWSLAFGTEAARSRALATVDGLPPAYRRFVAVNLLWHPRLLPLQGRVLPPLESDVANLQRAFFNDVARGRLEAARAHLSHLRMPVLDQIVWTYALEAWGLPIPDEHRTGSGAPDGDADPVVAFVLGARAAERGAWRDHAALLELLASAGDSLMTAGDSLQGRRARALADGLLGYGRWRRGDPPGAIQPLESAQRGATGFRTIHEDLNSILRLWLGRLHRELGDDEQAVRYFRSFWGLQTPLGPLGQYELGRTLERREDLSAARAAYRRFLLAWSEPDPPLANRVEHAKNVVRAR